MEVSIKYTSMVKVGFTKSKVLFILHLPPPIHGAAVVGSYIKNSKFINDEFDAKYINLSTSINLNEIGKGGFKKIVTFLSLVKNVASTIRRNKFDICYMSLTSSGPGFYKDLIIIIILKIANSNIIYHFHNKGVRQASNNWINRFLYKYTFRNTKSILLSAHLYSEIKMYVKADNIYYCSNGIPQLFPAFNKKDSSAMTYPAACKILYLSNMMVAKGVYVLLDALKILKSKEMVFDCCFVGAWSDITPELFKAKVAENGLANFISAHGPKYGDEKQSFLAEADVFVFPTLNETFGLVTLEAMQCGLPVVSTWEGGIPDVVVNGETGFLIPKNSADELANKLELLIRLPDLRAKMGAAGKRRYEKLYTLDKFESNFITVVKDAIG